jgi:hypothetical protein
MLLGGLEGVLNVLQLLVADADVNFGAIGKLADSGLDHLLEEQLGFIELLGLQKPEALLIALESLGKSRLRLPGSILERFRSGFGSGAFRLEIEFFGHRPFQESESLDRFRNSQKSGNGNYLRILLYTVCGRQRQPGGFGGFFWRWRE